MKIAVNTRFLLNGGLEGLGWFTFEVLRRMVAAHPEDEFLFLFDRKYPDKFIFGPNVKGYVLSPPARHPILATYWNQWQVGRFLKKQKPDVYLTPDGFFPLKTKVPVVAIIHDIAHQVLKNNIRRADQLYYDYFIPRIAGRADRIITVSEFSKNEIHRILGIPTDKIRVVYNAPREVFRPSANDEIARTRHQLTGGHPYFIYIGSIHPRKNLARLIEAYDQFKEEGPFEEHLVLAGRYSWQYADVKKAIDHSPFRESIHVTGYITDEQIASYLGASKALVLISLYEGFGIPLVEAMAAEVPIICSNQNALSEIAAGAALKVNPKSTAEVKHALERMSGDTALGQALVNKGRERLESFSWDITAGKVYRVCNELNRGRSQL